MAEGKIVVTSVREIDIDDVTDDLAIRSGFANPADLFATARHGRGDIIYLVRFHYEPR